MNRFTLSCAVAALLAGSLAAQQIQVSATSAWTVNPGSSLTSTSFFFGTSPDQIQIGLVTECGTSATPGAHTVANATFHGDTSGPTVSGSAPTQIDQASEHYTHLPFSSTGHVTCNLNADADTAASGVSHTGTGYRGVANASLTVTCNAYSLTASCRALGSTSNTPPLLMTVPQSGFFSNGGQANWFVAMDSRADANGSVTGVTSLTMVAACIAYGIVTLN